MKASKTIYPFKRKSKRVSTGKSIDLYILDELEDQYACDCFIEVKEGLIPAHTIILFKSKVMKQALKGEMKEGIDKVFSMIVWNTSQVLDIIECLYTDSLQHLTDDENRFQTAHIVNYLDISNLGLKLLEHLSNCAISKVAQKSNLLQQYTFDLILCVWMVEEAFGELKGKSQVVIANFCQIFFQNKKFSPGELTTQALTYLLAFSPSTMLSIVNHCASLCGKYDWIMVLNCVSLWVHGDPVKRVHHTMDILRNVCFVSIPKSFTIIFQKDSSLFYNDKRYSTVLAAVERHKMWVEHCKRENENWIASTPYTLYNEQKTTLIIIRIIKLKEMKNLKKLSPHMILY